MPPGPLGWAGYQPPPRPAIPYLAGTGDRIGARLIDLLIEWTVVLLVCLPLISSIDLRPLLNSATTFTWVEYVMGSVSVWTNSSPFWAWSSLLPGPTSSAWATTRRGRS